MNTIELTGTQIQAAADEAVMPRSRRGEPVWELAELYPKQGEWTEDEYLAIDTNRLIELSQGCLVFLPMPTIFHQLILDFLYTALKAFVQERHLGLVLFAPLRVRMWPGEIREPDIVFLRPERIVNVHRPPRGADFVMEVVSPGGENSERDWETKRRVYAEAGVPEYWIVDPQRRVISVMALTEGNTYEEHGPFQPGGTVSSVTLPGFQVAVADVFAAGEIEQQDQQRGTGNQEAGEA